MHDRSFSPGKIILSGEHSVVYGQPAIVLATSLGSVAEVVSDKMFRPESQPESLTELGRRLVNIFTEFTGREEAEEYVFFKTFLPLQSGMGSSASLAAAGLKALSQHHLHHMDKDELFALVQESEKYIHGNPSGVDAAAVVYAGIQLFRKSDQGVHRTELTQLVQKVPPFLLIQTGIPTETTKEMVEYVAHRRAEEPEYQLLLNDIGAVTVDLINSLEEEQPEEFFAAISHNQRLLERVGVVGQRARDQVAELEKLGAAVKITGAGGIQTGSGMLIAFHQDLRFLKQHLQKNNNSVLETELFDWSMV